MVIGIRELERVGPPEQILNPAMTILQMVTVISLDSNVITALPWQLLKYLRRPLMHTHLPAQFLLCVSKLALIGFSVIRIGTRCAVSEPLIIKCPSTL